MKTFKEFIGESLKDKMSAKSHDDIKGELKLYFKELKVQSDYIDKEKAFKDVDLESDNLYLVFDYEDHYELFEKYFDNIIDTDDNIISFEDDDVEFRYYPDKKIMWHFDGVLTECWYFEGIHINDMIDFFIENFD